MKIVSLNVGLPRWINYDGTSIETGIFKDPVTGRIRVRRLNLDGDRQADLTVHGGPYKAVYAYPSEHYDFWKREFPAMDLPWGMFGENFTTEGLLESDLHIGDRVRAGSALLMVRQPRMPCYKLAAKFQRNDMIGRFLHSGHSGFYFSVEEEGEVAGGDRLDIVSREESAITIAEMNRLYSRDKYNQQLLAKATSSRALPEDWRIYLSRRLDHPIAHS